MSRPLGVLLAGGLGRRLGGDKPSVELADRPLISYPLAALRAELDEVVFAVRAETQLPALEGPLNVWVEPDGVPHPLAGIVHALRKAGGRPILACAADLPLLTPAVVRAIVTTDPEGAPAVVPRAAGGLQPLVALYTSLALPALLDAAAGAATRDVVAALGPKIIEIDDDDAFFNVNAPEDLLRASAMLDARRRATEPNVSA